MSRFTDTLTVSPIPDGKTWVIRCVFGYDVGEEGSNEKINVPEGFVTDFASVPRPLWIIFPRWGKYGNAAVIHDYLYWQQKYSRKRADELFLEAMEVLSVGWFQKYSLYYAVRLFGCCAWRSNKKSKENNAKFDKDKASSILGG
jgi:uncharacterized protein DUF1353